MFVLALCFAALLAAGAAGAERRNKDEAGEKGTGLDRRVAEKLVVAYEHLQNDRFDEALEIVDELGKRRSLGAPELAQIHRFRGYIMVNKGMPERAVEEFEKSLAQHALDHSAEQVMTYSMAQLYTQLGNYDRALALIDTWFQGEESPKADAFYLQAMILVQQEKFEAALAPAKAAVDRSPQPRESWLQLLAVIQSQLRDYASLAGTLERLVAIAPGKKQYWLQLAAVQKQLDREAKALATLRLADEGELLSEDRELRQLARLLFLRELPFECASVMEAALDAGVVKEDAEAYELVSNCLIAARASERALEPLARAGELSSDGEMYLLLGQLHLQRERYAPALEALENALAKSKPEQRGAVQLLIGVAQLGSERLDDAERAFRAAQGDEKLRRAAESYLRYVQEQRRRREQEQALRIASQG